MAHDQVLPGFRSEAQQLAGVMLTLDQADFARPTECPPWTVKELSAHVHGAVVRIESMLAGPGAPDASLIDAAGYYRPDHRFSAETDADRIASAQRAAAAWPTGQALADGFAEVWQSAARAVEAAGPERPVRTRHGDWMRLDDFLVTRVVELAVHGLDLATALRRGPWLTPDAGKVVAHLLLGAGRATVRDGLGWDQLTLIRKATGRAPVTPDEAERLAALRVRWLAFGPAAA